MLSFDTNFSLNNRSCSMWRNFHMRRAYETSLISLTNIWALHHIYETHISVREISYTLNT